jgi:hypothetical protein
MKLCVVAPSEEYLGLAGVRIRYLRIEAHLREQGHELSIEVIDKFTSLAQFRHDIYLFSKCYDARAFLIGRLLLKTGKLVGIDLFDDYFSQSANSRFICHREWLRTMAGLTDFFLCSTARMKEVAATYMPGIAGHILNDPFDSIDLDAIAASTRRNLERTRATGQIDVGWFGIGDNPHFAVGLRDLQAYGHVLQGLGRSGFEVRLKILTNKRALTADGLEMLARLPVPWSLDEWSVKRERALLAGSLVAFIPVNAQQFSVAKSLNRAVSTLTGGAQVLSAGFPLYAPLGAFIYRDSDALLADIERGEMLVSERSLPRMVQLFGSYCDPAREAADFGAFLVAQLERKRRLHPGKPVAVREGSQGVVHGVRTRPDVHRFTQRLRHLSIGSPYSEPALNYDLRFVVAGDGLTLELQLSERAGAQLSPDYKSLLVAGLSASGKPVHILRPPAPMQGLAGRIARACAGGSKLARLAGYAPVMADVRTLAQSMFPGIEIRISEIEAPFWADPALLAPPPPQPVTATAAAPMGVH